MLSERWHQMPDGPSLLKERRYLRKDAAEQLWKSLQTQGWKKTRPLWCELPNHERSSPPFLTVLLLLTGEDQEEGDGASEREDGTSGVWAPQRSFFGVPSSPTECVCGWKIRSI